MQRGRGGMEKYLGAQKDAEDVEGAPRGAEGHGRVLKGM